MTHGPEYKTNGKRPVWLKDGDEVSVVCRDGITDNRTARHITLCGWPCISAIRLPADHWANPAIEAGYEPWAGGNEAPDDWDRSSVLLRNGAEWTGLGFSWKQYPLCDGYDIIGYKKNESVQALKDEIKACNKLAMESAQRLGIKTDVRLADLEKESFVSELPKDVTALVIAARRVWEGLDFSTIASAEGRALDKSLEAFSDRVQYEDEPHESVVSEEVQDWAIEAALKDLTYGGITLNMVKIGPDEHHEVFVLARMIQAYEPHRKPKDRDEEIAEKWVRKWIELALGDITSLEEVVLSAIKEAKS